MRKLLLTFAVSVLGSIVASSVVRAIDPKTIETDWTYDLYYASHTGVTTFTDDIAGMNGWGVSSNTVSSPKDIVGFAWTVYSAGAGSEFTIAFPTKTFSRSAITTPTAGGGTTYDPVGWPGSAPSISTTPTIGVISGIPLNGNFEALVTNPVFTFSNLGAGATVHLYVEIGRRKLK